MSIPWLALGTWILCIGWFGFNVMSAQSLNGVTGLVAVCAGSDIMHPIGSFIIGGVAGVAFVYLFQIMQNRWKIDDVLGVWPLHGVAGAWGGIAAGIFGMEALGGVGGVSFGAQFVGTLIGVTYAAAMGYVVYSGLKASVGIRLSAEKEAQGADLSIHKIRANSEADAMSGYGG